jgi:mannosyltransferase OCH1-like enzyme
MSLPLRELSAYLAPRGTNPSNKKDYKYIPKKIFQTWETNQVSSGMYDAVYTWIDKNPDWEYHFFDKDDRRNFIKENFPKKVLDAYDTLIPGAFKADLWRYCVLYVHGGVYVDIKAELLVNLNEIIPFDVEFLSIKDPDGDREHPICIYQAFLCSKPKHKFFKKAIDMICENVEVGYYGYDIFSPTGPSALGEAINLVTGKTKYSCHDVGFHDVSGYKYILWSDDFDNNICRTDKKKSFLKRSYKLYYQERHNFSARLLVVSYGRSWLFYNIYTHGKVFEPYPKKYNQKIKSERASWVNSLYKYGSKRKARRGVLVTIKKGHFSLRLLLLLIRHEFVRPILGIFKLRNKKNNIGIN